MAYEASAAEGSEASGALSDSTGVSPGGFHGTGGGAVTSGRPFTGGAPGRQRSMGAGCATGGSSPGREAGASAAAFLQPMPSGASFGSSYGSAYADVGGAAGAAAWTAPNAQLPLLAAPSLAARSDGGSSDTAAVYTGDLNECLLCGLRSCFPTGPATIR